MLQSIYRSLVSEPSDYPRFITCVGDFYANWRSGKLSFQASPCHLLNHQPNLLVQLFLQSPAQKRSAKKSLFSYTFSKTYEYIWGWVLPFPFQCQSKEKGDWESSTIHRTKGPGHGPWCCFPLLRQFWCHFRLRAKNISCITVACRYAILKETKHWCKRGPYVQSELYSHTFGVI